MSAQLPPPKGNGALRWILAHGRSLAGAAFVVAVAVVAALVLLGSDPVKPRVEPASDTPPAEYLYLDSARVLAYLGQARGGLSESEKRTLSAKSAREASLKGGPLAEVTGSSEQATSIEETVTPAAADRFLTLLAYLRARKAPRVGRDVPFLQDLDARTRRDSRRRYLDAFNARRVRRSEREDGRSRRKSGNCWLRSAVTKDRFACHLLLPAAYSLKGASSLPA